MSPFPKATDRASVGAIRAVRRALARRADPNKAVPMQAYMKSTMPYLGVQSTEMRAACREAFGSRPLSDLETWRDTVLRLWRDARYREERYAAIELTGYTRYEALLHSAALIDVVPSTHADHAARELSGIPSLAILLRIRVAKKYKRPF